MKAAHPAFEPNVVRVHVLNELGSDGKAALGRHHRVMLQPQVFDRLPNRATVTT